MSAQRMQLGPFFSGGALLGGVKLYAFEAGTTTPRSLWADRDQTTPLSHPFIADSAGILNFFADGLYKLVICGPNSTGPSHDILYTLDNWSILDTTGSSLDEGPTITASSTIAVGPYVWAHIVGSATIAAITGSIPFFWAVFDGTPILQHSSVLILPGGADRQVQTGECLFFLNDGGGVWRLASWWGPRQQPAVVASASMTPPPPGSLLEITGSTNISTIAPRYPGYEWTGYFTNAAGCNLIASSDLVTPWGVDYRTIPQEMIRFVQVSGTAWLCYSLNGPRERTGQSINWSGLVDPPGFLSENGAAVSRTTYSGLFAVIGTTYGAGDGSTTFNVPDSRGRVDIMLDGGANRITSASVGGANANTLGGTGGAQTHTLTIAEIPSHGLHGVSGNQDFGMSGTRDWGSIGGGGAHSNTQPWIAKKRYIRF